MNKNQRRLIFSLSYIILFSVMNGTMFNVITPTIANDYNLTPSQVSWVVVSYGIVFAIGSVTYGKLSDLFSLKRLILFGLSIFSLGSIIGFFATNYVLVVLARIIQASGAAAIPALAMISATRYFPVEKRGYVLGIIASTVAVGSGVGPIIAGLISQFIGWNYLFIFSILILFALPFLIKYLPKEEVKGGKFDIFGAVSFALGIAFLLLSINMNSLFIFAFILFALLFIYRIRTTDVPFIQISLLKNKPFRLLLLVGFLTFFVTMSSFFVLPIMLDKVNGLASGSIGLVLFPGSMTAALLGMQAGKLSDRFGNRIVIKWAALIMLLGFASISTAVGANPIIISILFIMVYIGFSSIQASLGSYVSKVLDKKDIGIGMGLYNLASFLSGAFGPALISRFLEMNTAKWNILNTSNYFSFSNSFILLAVITLLSLGVLTLVQAPMLKKLQPSKSL